MSEDKLVKQLREDVARICPPLGRTVGSVGHRQAREYLSGRLRDLGLKPYRGSSFGMAYRDAERKFFNLVGVIPCGNGTRPPVLIGAHYDSVIDSPCADDNAAAVAIALAAAAQLTGQKLNRDIVIALFDAEEPPHFLEESMGSIRFYEDQMRPEGVHAAIIMDLVGHDVTLPFPGVDKVRPGLKNLICMTGAESHAEVAGVVSRQDFGQLVPVATLNSNVGDMSDHHVFRKHGVPYLFLSCGRWEHYHQESDTPEKLNYAKMALITSLLVDLTIGLAAAPLEHRSPKPGTIPECDTQELELRFIREAFGPLLPTVLGAVGLQRLETRKDLDLLFSVLQWQM